MVDARRAGACPVAPAAWKAVKTMAAATAANAESESFVGRAFRHDIASASPSGVSTPELPIEGFSAAVKPARKSTSRPPANARQILAEPPLREIISTASRALETERSPSFLIDSAQRLEIAATPTKQKIGPNSNR